MFNKNTGYKDITGVPIKVGDIVCYVNSKYFIEPYKFSPLADTNEIYVVCRAALTQEIFLQRQHPAIENKKPLAEKNGDYVLYKFPGLKSL